MWRFALRTVCVVITVPSLLVCAQLVHEDDSFRGEENEITLEKEIPIPKCCDFGYVIGENGCVPNAEVPFNPSLSTYEHNETHINDEALNGIAFRPFVHKLSCEFGKYPLIPNLDPLLSDGDNFVLFENGSLVLVEARIIFNQTDYCIESVNVGDNSNELWLTTPFLCVEVVDNSRGRYGFFVVCCIARAISEASLVIVLIGYLFGVRYPTTQDTCIIFYATFLLAKDILVWIAQFTPVEGRLCSVVGAVNQALVFLALISLNQIFVEIYRQIKRIEDSRHWSERHLEFCGVVSLLVAAILVLIGVLYPYVVPVTFVKLHPDQETCIFMGDKISAFYYCVPSFIAIVTNVIAAVAPLKEILKYNSTLAADVRWEEKKEMLFASNLLLILMVTSWIKAVFEFLWELENGLTLAVDVLESLVGFFVLLLYVVPRRHRVFENLKTINFPIRSRRGDDTSTESGLTVVSVLER